MQRGLVLCLLMGASSLQAPPSRGRTSLPARAPALAAALAPALATQTTASAPALATQKAAYSGGASPTFSASGGATAAQVLNVSMPMTWYTGAALLSQGGFLLSGGDWYASPVVFSVFSYDSLASPAAPSHTFASVPGSVWPVLGQQSAALFSGMSFTTDGAVYAAYAGGSAEGPEWVESVPGVSGNWWEVSAPIQSSQNGSIVAYALTSMDHYDPLGPKHAEVLVMDTSAWPQRALLRDQLPNGTAVEDVHLSADASILVLISAWDPSGAINSSLVRVYSVVGASVLASFTTGWVDAACLSPDGRTLVLTTCDSENAIEVYSIAGGLVTLLANSSYPPMAPTSTFTYADTCQITASGALWVVFPLWWGGAINQTAVAYWASLPSSPTHQPVLPPSSLWLSPGISPSLQDSITASAALGPYFVYSSWGGRALKDGSPPPPTVHIFSQASPAAPLLEVSTPAALDPSLSGSIQSFDLAMNGTDLLVLCEGLDNVRARWEWAGLPLPAPFFSHPPLLPLFPPRSTQTLGPMAE